jgi:dTDP-4-amino-4,6-dideoxygalactose transaminase
MNSRLDEIQAAFLSVKLKKLDAGNELRRKIAQYYIDNINNELVTLPYPSKTKVLNYQNHVWHVFAVRVASREKFQKYLYENGIQTVIHYPIPPHKQPAYAEWNSHSYPISEKIHEQIISLPISPVMKDNECKKVAEVINGYSFASEGY